MHSADKLCSPREVGKWSTLCTLEEKQPSVVAVVSCCLSQAIHLTRKTSISTERMLRRTTHRCQMPTSTEWTTSIAIDGERELPQRRARAGLVDDASGPL